MYKIKNITRGKLLLFDIGVKLNSGQIIDLEEILPREKIEQSVHLKVAEANELLAVLHRDVVKEPAGFDPAMLLEMEMRIRQQIVQQMQAAAPVAAPAPVVPPQATQNPEIAALSAQLAALINKMGNQPMAAGTVSASDAVEEYTPDDDKLREVHAKALKRMTKGATGQIEAKETIGKSDASKRADELEDFLK